MVYQWYTMPSPRFWRLPVDRRAHILSVARRHIAVAGPEAASYNQIIADAGISKTSAYLYFDGKDDLVAEVQRDVMQRIADMLGTWRAARSARGFFAQLGESAERLQQHLAEHLDDLGVLGAAGSMPQPYVDNSDPWLDAMLEDGRRLGVVRSDIAPALMAAATRALLQVGDAFAIAALRRGDTPELAPLWSLLRGLWGTPTKERR